MSSTPLPDSLVLDAVRVTEAAAIASWTMVGRGDEKEAGDEPGSDAETGKHGGTPWQKTAGQARIAVGAAVGWREDTRPRRST